MKKVLFLPVIFAVILSLSGCEKDESLDPRPLVIQGQFMRLDIDKKRDRIDADNLETSSFGGLLTNPSNDVIKYKLKVRLVRDNVGISDYIDLDSITSFPHDLAINAQKVQDAYAATGVNVIVKEGDVFRFVGFSYNTNKVEVAYRDLSATVRTEPGYKQAYKFNTSVERGNNLKTEYSNYQTLP
jgi:hypothetical protein